jgi:hypothetical protein
MATVRAGDILQILIYDREFDPKIGASVNYHKSGRNNESRPTGNGGLETTQTIMLGGFDSLPISLDPSKKDLEYLQNAADSGEPGNCAMTLINGTTYGGQLVIQGELNANSGDGQIDITALGPVFEQI